MDQTAYASPVTWQVGSDHASEWRLLLSVGDFSTPEGNLMPSDRLEIRLPQAAILPETGCAVLPASQVAEWLPVIQNPLTILVVSPGQDAGVCLISPEFRLTIPAAAYSGSYLGRAVMTLIAGPTG